MTLEVAIVAVKNHTMKFVEANPGCPNSDI